MEVLITTFKSIHYYYPITNGSSTLPSTLYNKHIEGIYNTVLVLLDFSLTVKAATVIFISGCGSAISSAWERKSGFIYNLVKI